MTFELQFVTFMGIFLSHCHATFQYKEIFPFLVIVTWQFHIWNPFLFVVGLYKTPTVCCFFRFTCSNKGLSNQISVVMLHVMTSFYTKYPKNTFFISATIHEKHTVKEEHSFARDGDKMCFSPISNYHVFFCVSLRSYYRNWTHCVSQINTWTVSIHCLSIDFVKILLSRVFKCLIRCKEQSFLTKKRVDRMHSIAKKRLLRKKYRKLLLKSFQKTKSTQTSGSVFGEKLEQVKKID